MMEKNSKIYIAGHNGLVGSAIIRKLKKEGYNNILYATHKELDLTNQIDTFNFFEKNKPEYVFLAAAKVGGIIANSNTPADFIYENIMIEANVIRSCYLNNVKKLIFLGSSCIYPRNCPQPIKEEYLLTSELEKTNDGYAIAKIAGITMCKKYNYQFGTNYISVMPTNLYGQCDNYDLQNSHVLPAMIRKIHEAKERGDKNITLWGTGNPYREFLHVDDLADALLFLMNNYNGEDIINIGTGIDLKIKDLAQLIKNTVGFNGEILFDSSKPDGTPKKLLDVSKLREIGWKYSIDIEDGINMTYNDFLKNIKKYTN